MDFPSIFSGSHRGSHRRSHLVASRNRLVIGSRAGATPSAGLLGMINGKGNLSSNKTSPIRPTIRRMVSGCKPCWFLHSQKNRGWYTTQHSQQGCSWYIMIHWQSDFFDSEAWEIGHRTGWATTSGNETLWKSNRFDINSLKIPSIYSV